LLELTHKLNVGNNFLLNLNLKLEPWKNIREKTRADFSSKQIYLFWKSWQVSSFSKLNIDLF
jgi:hypothetical protein